MSILKNIRLRFLRLWYRLRYGFIIKDGYMYVPIRASWEDDEFNKKTIDYWRENKWESVLNDKDNKPTCNINYRYRVHYWIRKKINNYEK